MAIPTTLPPPRLRRRAHHTASERRTRALERQRRALRDISLHSRVDVPLDVPVFIGWERYFTIRHDVLASPDGPYLSRVLRLIQHVEPCNRHGVLKVRDHYRGRKLRAVPHNPRSIDLATYNAMSPKMQRHFVAHVHRHHVPATPHRPATTRVEVTYVFANQWQLRTRVRPRYRTHVTHYTVNTDADLSLVNHHLDGPSEFRAPELDHLRGVSWHYDHYNTGDPRVPLIEHPDDPSRVTTASSRGY